MNKNVVGRLTAFWIVISLTLLLMYGGNAVRSAYHHHRIEQERQARQERIVNALNEMSDAERALYVDIYHINGPLSGTYSWLSDPTLDWIYIQAIIDKCPEILDEPWFHEYSTHYCQAIIDERPEALDDPWLYDFYYTYVCPMDTNE